MSFLAPSFSGIICVFVSLYWRTLISVEINDHKKKIIVCEMLQVQVLLAELAMVEEEIVWLERKIEELKLKLFQERSHTREWEMRHNRQEQRSRLWQQNNLFCEGGNRPLLFNEQLSRSQNYEVLRKERMNGERRASLGSTSEVQNWSSISSKNGKLKHMHSSFLLKDVIL